MASEKLFENKIKKYIEDQGGWQVKFFANRMTKSGVPDVLACINGHFVAVEVKAEHGTPSELQKYHVKKITNAGGYAIILYPQDWEDFKNLIRCIKGGEFISARWICSKINGRSFIQNGDT